MNRFDGQYKLRLRDNIGNPDVLNFRFQDIDKRVGSLEDVDKTWEAAVDKLNKTGSEQVNAALAPVYARIQAFASLNTVFSARSSTEIPLEEGRVTLIVDADDRTYFAPAAYISGFVFNDLSRAWLGKTVSYDSTTGALEVDIDRVTGVGQGANWQIHAASATDNASAAAAAAQAAATATTASDAAVAAAATIGEKTTLATTAATDAVAARDAAASSATLVSQIRAAVQSMNDEVRANYSAFNERYLGAKAADPMKTNSGAALTNGILYYNTTVGEMRIFKSSIGGWVAAYISAPDTPVTTVFGRDGVVGAADGDYNAAQIVVDPSENITSTRVAAALEEIAAAAAAKASPATTLAGYGITDAYTKDEIDVAIGDGITDKADKATTLAGYGIADAYTKDEIDTAVSSKADASAVYTKGQVDTALSGKATKATTLAGYGIADAYKKSEVDTAMNSLSGSIATGLGNKADKATTLAGYGIADAYKKSEVDSALQGKANATDVTTALAGKQATLGFTPLDAAAYTAADVMAKVKANDGSGSGLDADTLDGLHAASFYSNASQVGAAMVNLGLGGIGTYGFFNGPMGGAGATVAGSTLSWADGDNEWTGTHPTGTWRRCGYIADSDDTTLFQRIA
ncbi:hypothetical protein [Hyphomicrobium sp. 802]|uniref:hypothetical protein n=1 Tax=Hyphomicrobium sp. 802 TaxID=1112272 RepID=UPI00045E6CBD|nr:hypothetical protein [Hyphomicrobium sp. 802]